MDLNDVRGIVAQAQEACWDAQTTLGELATGYSGGFRMDFDRNMTQVARAELLQKAGVPATFHGKEFFDRLDPTTQHFVVADAVRGNRLQNKAVLARFQGDTLRAVVSEDYTCVPHLAVIDAILGLGLDLEVKKFWPEQFTPDTKTMHLRLTKPEDYSVGNNGDMVKVMFHIVNSEIGKSALVLDTGLWRQICSNGLMARVGGAVVLQERHIYHDPQELIDVFAAAMLDAEETAMEFLQLLIASRDVHVDPAVALTRFAMSGKMRERVREAWKDDTLFGFYNALTQSAQALSWLSQVEMERRARNVLEMDFDTYGHSGNCPTCGNSLIKEGIA